MKRILISMLAVAALSSCSKNVNPAEPVTPQDGIIRVFTGIDAPKTKALADQATGLTGAQFIKVDGTSSAPTDFSSTVTGYHATAGAVAATSGQVTFSSAPSYNMNNSNAWMVAYFPAGTLANNVVKWTINGYTDILRTDAAWSAGTYSAELTGSTGTKLTFNHQLSQIEVVCKAESGSAIATVRAAWGKVKKVEFVDAPTEMTYTLNALAIANGTTKADFSLLKNYNDASNAFEAIDIPENSNTTANAVAMLAPVAATSSESFKLKITTDGPTTGTGDDMVQTVSVSLGGNKTAMSKGKKHEVTLNFKADGKNIAVAATTIEQWSDGAKGSNDVVKP